ncbi:MAG TPA: hybrid sensor histidine kinase/response regulator [Cytophagales bacterium]|nr:hybrid sensor histidine kinase/response regulator [Cytophagales bacterium]HRG08920.1 hybrid sensor histidine kinase/response regulator [Cyclobacteriaceae bacterium]
MKKELKILMLEDMEEDAHLVERTLRKEGFAFDWQCVDTHAEFVDALTEFKPDVILSDHAMPQFNSIEALKLLKHQGINVPFILVTGTVSEEFAVNCLKLGAHDYVLKSNLSRLPSAIKQSLKQFEFELKRKKAENDLRRQNEELVKINRELDNFVYSVSHNLRAPLLSTLGLIQLAQRDDTQRTFSQYWEMMTRSIFNLDETIKEILDYSKNARIEIARQKVDLKKLVSEVQEKVQYIEYYDRMAFHVNVHQKTDFYSDPFRLSIILTNLISNAIIYSNSYVASMVSIDAVIDGKEARLKISDNGIGIESHLMPRIFEMFFRGTDRSDGAGLGLYIVREAVEKLKGSITVESVFGEGTQFHITIPNQPQGHHY